MLRRDLLKRMTTVVCGIFGVKAVAETPTVTLTQTDFLCGPDCVGGSQFVLHNNFSPNTIKFYIDYGKTEVARIDSDGIMRFTVDATDENAKQFVELIEQVFNRRLTGVDVNVA